MSLRDKFKNKPKIFKRLKIIGCGCLTIFVLLVVLLLVFGGILIKKLVSGTIKQQTGVVQTNPNNNQGQSYTDPKTGATVNLGINKVPDSFPKDFPIYPGSTVTTSEVGNADASSGKGFWLTLITNDTAQQVATYYQSALPANGWSAVQASTTSSTGTSWAISKGNLSGYLTVEKAASDKPTSILVILGEVSR